MKRFFFESLELAIIVRSLRLADYTLLTTSRSNINKIGQNWDYKRPKDA